MSRICEEFHCTPSVAMREWRRHPELMEHILDARAYAQAYQRFTHATGDDSLPPEGEDPMLDLVWEFYGEHDTNRR